MSAAARDWPAFYSELYAEIGALTPLETDCGRLCGARCCRGGAGEGMLLFPHEEEALAACAPPDARRILDAPAGRLLVCGGTCAREARPLACRIFPLLPLLGEDGIVRAAVDPGAWKLCPLARQIESVRLSAPFVRAVRRVGRLLTRDGDCLRELRARTAEAERLLRLLPLPGGGIVSGRRLG